MWYMRHRKNSRYHYYYYYYYYIPTELMGGGGGGHGETILTYQKGRETHLRALPNGRLDSNGASSSGRRRQAAALTADTHAIEAEG